MREYYASELEADFVVHLVGMATGTLGAAILIALAATSSNLTVFWSVLVYSAGLVAMLTCSAAYHTQRSSARRDLLRRLDHAAIFVMIAWRGLARCCDRADWLSHSASTSAPTDISPRVARKQRMSRGFLFARTFSSRAASRAQSTIASIPPIRRCSHTSRWSRGLRQSTLSS